MHKCLFVCWEYRKNEFCGQSDLVTRKRCLSGHTEISQSGKTFPQGPVSPEATLNIDKIHRKDQKTCPLMPSRYLLFFTSVLRVLCKYIDHHLKTS